MDSLPILKYAVRMFVHDLLKAEIAKAKKGQPTTITGLELLQAVNNEASKIVQEIIDDVNNQLPNNNQLPKEQKK